MIGAIKNEMPKIGLKQIGVPKIIGSLILHIPGINERRPKARYFSTLLFIIKRHKAKELPEPPKTAILNICKFIKFVGAKPLATRAAFAPVAATPVANTIGKITLLPFTPISQSKLPRVTIKI